MREEGVLLVLLWFLVNIALLKWAWICLLSCWMQWGCISYVWLDTESFQLHMLHPQNWSVLLNHYALKKKGHKMPILINLKKKKKRCKNEALKMSGENSSIIFSLISGSRVVLIYSWITWESLCRYPQIAEFTSWLKSCMKISDPKIVPQYYCEEISNWGI